MDLLEMRVEKVLQWFWRHAIFCNEPLPAGITAALPLIGRRVAPRPKPRLADARQPQSIETAWTASAWRPEGS